MCIRDRYKENSVLSMSSAEQLLLLYDEADKQLARASLYLEEEEYILFDKSMERTTKIVRYLLQILDMEQPISHDLARIYHYLLYDIGRIVAGRKRQKDEIPRIRHILSELRDAFDQASRIAAEERR